MLILEYWNSSIIKGKGGNKMIINDNDLHSLAEVIFNLPEKPRDITIWLVKNIEMIEELVELLPITLDEANELYEIAIERNNYILIVLTKTKMLNEKRKADNS
jgi:hypothetical protein